MESVNTAHDLCSIFLEEIMERIAPGGTLVLPTFTYSFPRHQTFDVDASKSDMGRFAEWLRGRPDAARSCDPCYSVAAVGDRAVELTRNASTNSFDDDSFFARLFRCHGKILNLNFDAGSTFVHFVERELGVRYRFDKTFTGIIRQNGVERPANSTIWVRYLSDDALEAAFEPFDKLAREQGLFVTSRLGRGELGTISAQDTYNLVCRTLGKRPWFLTKAEALGIADPLIVSEEQMDHSGLRPVTNHQSKVSVKR
jgi:aminoglycoside 3-N-acetyltransferase